MCCLETPFSLEERDQNMKSHRFRGSRWLWGAALSLLALALLLSGCGTQPTPQIVVVTATFTVPPVVQVVTATFTPTSEAVATESQPLEVSATPLPPEPTATAVPPVEASQPTATLVPPTSTDTPLPPPTNTPVPPTATAAPKPTAKPVSNPSQWWVAYTVVKPPFDTQSYSIWLMRGNGAEAEKVIDNASEPGFTAKADKFCYYHWNDGIWVIDLKKQTASHVVHNQWSGFPSFSPDGSKIAYQENVNPRKIHIVNVDGTGDYVVTEGQRPSWSPKGGLIAYDSCIGSDCGIFTVQPNGQGRKQLTKDAGGAPAISPDGTKIAYQSAADGDTEIYVMNVDGSGKKQLTKNNFNDALAAWSPDGQYIYFRSDQAGKGWAVMRMRADGSDRTKIIDALVSPGYWEWEKMSVAKG
jgi:Tol biopolymer transport system component